MPRTARKISDLKLYHVMLRGNNREDVFCSRRDILIFLLKLAEFKNKFQFKIYAYCFMVNHVHLCLRESEKGQLSKFMHALETSYVTWYNISKSRCGHLFQGRYLSKPINDMNYFVSVIRYIHNNPVNAGKCKSAGEYGDSSYNCYFDEDPGIIDRDDVFEVIKPDEFAAFHNKEIDRDELEFIRMPGAQAPRVAKEDAGEIMQSISGCSDALQLMDLGMDEVIKIIEKFRKKGLSYRQIADFIKRGKSTVYRWVKADGG